MAVIRDLSISLSAIAIVVFVGLQTVVTWERYAERQAEHDVCLVLLSKRGGTHLAGLCRVPSVRRSVIKAGGQRSED